jgi:hypothetical protein
MTVDTPQPTLMAVKEDLMTEVLLYFDLLFTESSGLPPPREQSHQIRL